MKVFCLIIALVFGVTFIALPRNAGGWFWDAGGALGLLAFAGLMFQMVPYARTVTSKRHQTLGYWVLGTAVLHAFWLLIGDDVVRFYLQAGAPLYMWLGLASLIVLAVLAIIAKMPDRARLTRRFATFRLVHRILGFATIITATLHIVLSGFYYPSWPQIALVVLMVAAMCFGRPVWTRLSAPPTASGLAFLVVGVLAVGAFVLVRNVAS